MSVTASQDTASRFLSFKIRPEPDKSGKVKIKVVADKVFMVDRHSVSITSFVD